MTCVQEAGALHVGDIAQRTRLGVDLLVPVLQQRLGTAIPGKLEGGLLYTDAHIARIRVSASLQLPAPI
jgi:E3 UFM1-protein ligase 1